MSDSIASLVCLSANLAMWFAGARLARAIFSQDGVGERIVHGIVFCWASIVGNALLLNAAVALTPYHLILSVMLTSIGVGWFVGRSESFSGPFQVCAMPRVPNLCTMHPLLAVGWLAIACTSVAKCVVAGLSSFPSDWDSLAYHLPLVDHWIQSESLYVPDCAYWYCPGNSELVAYWLVAPFSGDFWYSFNSLPSLALLSISSVKLLAACRVWRPLRHLTAMVIVTSNVTWRQLDSNENDLAVAALFVTCLWYATRIGRRKRMGDVVFCSLAFGLLAGIKYAAIGYAAAAGLAVVGLLILRGRFAEVGLISLQGITGGVALGGYWYLRNYLVSGLPLFPKGFVESEDLWSQIRPDVASSALIRSGRPQVVPLLYEAILSQCGWGFFVSVFALPLTIFLLLAAAFAKSVSRGQRVLRIWLAGILFLVVSVYVNTPNIVETAPGAMNMLKSGYHSVRLGFAALVMPSLALSVILSDVILYLAPIVTAIGFGNVRRQASQFVFIAVALNFILLNYWGYAEHDLTPTLGGAIVLLSLGALVCWNLPSRVASLLLVISFALFPAVTYWRAASWHRDFNAYYTSRLRSGIFYKLPSLLKEGGTLCVCDYVYYPFLGSARENHVCRPLWVSDVNSLEAFVEGHRSTLLVARHVDRFPQQRYKFVPAALELDSAAYAPVFSDGVYRCVFVIPRQNTLVPDDADYGRP